MFRAFHAWVLRCLSIVFDRDTAYPPIWTSEPLISPAPDSTAIIWLAGLSSNGHRRSSAAVQALFDKLGGSCSVYARNLWGHSGRYEDFRRSRSWHWVSDLKNFSKELLASGRHSKIILVADSTGALVSAVVASWFLRGRQKDCLAGIVYVVPAWRLRNRANEALLFLVLIFYFVIAPVALLILALRVWWLWPICLSCWVVTRLVFPKIWIPNGDQLTAVRGFGKKWSELLTLGSCFFCGLSPSAILAASIYMPARWTAWMLTIFFVLLVLPLILTRRKAVVDETTESRLYTWIPVVTTSTMLPLQWYAGLRSRNLDIPTLVILAEKDVVVDNVIAEENYRGFRTGSKMLERVSCGHSEWPAEIQIAAAATIAKWIRQKVLKGAA